jgi:hypothetical protein
MSVTDAITQTLAGHVDHRTGEGGATIALVYGRGASHCNATGEPLRPREDVWIEVVDEHDRTSYIGLRAAVFDSADGQALLADWRRLPGWRVVVWDGRELWPERSPDEHSGAAVTSSRP